MKTTILTLIFLAGCNTATAQPHEPAFAPPAPPARHSLFEALNLNEEQQEAVQVLLQSHQEARAALHADMEAEMQTILTPDQFAQWQTIRPKAPRPPQPPKPPRGPDSSADERQ